MRHYYSGYIKCAVCGKVTPFQEPMDSGYGYGTKVACSYHCQLALVKKYGGRAESYSTTEGNRRLTPDERDMILDLRRKGFSAEKIAFDVGTTPQTVRRTCKRHGMPFERSKTA